METWTDTQSHPTLLKPPLGLFSTQLLRNSLLAAFFAIMIAQNLYPPFQPVFTMLLERIITGKLLSLLFYSAPRRISTTSCTKPFGIVWKPSPLTGMCSFKILTWYQFSLWQDRITEQKSLHTNMGDPKFNMYWISSNVIINEKIIMNSYVFSKYRFVFHLSFFFWFPRPRITWTSSKHLNNILPHPSCCYL